MRKLLCLFRGHVRSRLIYSNQDLAVYECGCCRAQYAIFKFGYLFNGVLEEDGIGDAERLQEVLHVGHRR